MRLNMVDILFIKSEFEQTTTNRIVFGGSLVAFD